MVTFQEDKDAYVLSSGRKVDAHQGFIGLKAIGHEGPFFAEGWDSFVQVSEWTADERGELAEAMVEAWRRWGGLLSYQGRPLNRWMDNVHAARIGEIARAAGTTPNAGDSIDRGLILVRLLDEGGYSVVPKGGNP